MSVKLMKPLSALALAMALASPAHATLTNAASDGYGLNAGVGVLGLPLLDLTLLGKAQGSTPGNYSDSAGLPLGVSASVGVGTLLSVDANVGANLLYGNASFDGATVKGEGGVENLGLSVDLSLLGASIDTIVGLSVGTLWSQSTITGDYGSLNPQGQSYIADLDLIIGAAIGLSDAVVDAALAAWVNAGSTANYHLLGGILNPLGIDLILNEQKLNEGCASLVNCANIETNALHLIVNPLGLYLVDVDLILGHSFAEVAAGPTPPPPPPPPPTVPLPGTLALMSLGLGLMAWVGRRRVLA